MPPLKPTKAIRQIAISIFACIIVVCFYKMLNYNNNPSNPSNPSNPFNPFKFNQHDRKEDREEDNFKPYSQKNSRLRKTESIKLPFQSNKYELFNYTVIPVLEGNAHNEAIRGHGECVKPSSMKYSTITNAKSQSVLVTHIIDIDDGKHFTDISGIRAPNREEMRAYFMNMYTVIQHNLDNPQIKGVFMLCESESMAEKLHRIDFENSTKLSIQNINSTITMGKQIEYGSRCFRDEIVIVGNQDIVLGDGWEKLNVTYMKENKIMYALTRYPSLRNCFATASMSNCLQHRGLGSYDAFVWHIKEHIKESIFIEKLGISKPSTKGMENVVVWIFQNVLKYKVTNPCLTLKIHHEHCVPIRDSRQGERVNTKVSGIAN